MPERDESRLLHHYLHRCAEQRPDNPAIVEEDRNVTFQQLWDQAVGLAAFLKDRGLDRGDRVALLLPKTIEAITSMFACLLRGAIYVPIQPRWPLGRIKTTLAECEPRFLIAEPSHQLVNRKEPTSDDAPVILDFQAGNRSSWRDALVQPEKPYRESNVEVDDPAFILFTSGSTGRPKGVTITHRAVGSFVEWSAGELRIGPEDRIACPSPLSFDLSTFDVFNMALRGAACHIVPESVVWMPRFIAQFLLDHRITVWYSVPSILASLLEESRFAESRLDELRVVVFAGEAFSSQNLLRLQRVLPGALCYNWYGPTETNVVTFYRVPADFDPSRPIPIGKPCPYADLHLYRTATDVGSGRQTGELLIGGESVMHGYWMNPDETEKAFVDVPIEGGKTKRYYKSGDQVVRHSNGEYTLIGRLDRQVKRRGFRIELGEIEAVLYRHAAIAESAVISSSGASGDTTITAFLRLRHPSALTEVEIRTHCSHHLPLYMLPDQIIIVNDIPKGDRGKTDYAALTALNTRRKRGGRSRARTQAHN